VNLQELTKNVADRLKLTQAAAKDTVHAVLFGVIEGLINEGHVRLGELGSFEVKERKARVSRNPRTGGKLFVPKKQAVVFRPASELKTHLAKRPMKGGADGEVDTQKDLDDARHAAESFLQSLHTKNVEAGKALDGKLYTHMAGGQDGTPIHFPDHKEKAAEAIHRLLGDFQHCYLDVDWELTKGGVQFNAILEHGSDKKRVAVVMHRSQGAWKVASITHR
jgi:DNA-binding protein HU-beta